MYFSLKEKKFWVILPLLLTVIIIVLLLVKNFSFDVISFKNGKSFSYHLFLLVIIIFPLLFLSVFDHWKEILFHKKLLLAGLSSFFIAINFSSHQSYQFSFLFAVVALIYLFFERKIFRPNTFFILLILYFGINALSLIWTNDIKLGVSYLREIIPLIYVSLLFSFFRLDKRDFDMIALFIFRFSIIYAFISICSWIIETRFLEFPLINSFGFSKQILNNRNCYDIVYAWSDRVHPTYNGINLLFALSIGWYYIFRKKVKDNINPYEFVFIVLSTLLIGIITASRFIIIVWIIVNLAGILFSIRNNKKLLISITLCFFITGAFSLAKFSDKCVNFIQDPIRVFHYEVAFESIKKNPFIGTGYGGIPPMIEKDNPAYVANNNFPPNVYQMKHPDNQLLSDFMQTGVFGFALITLILSFPLFLSIKNKDWLLFVNSLFFLILMNIESPLMYVNGIFTFTLIFNLLLNRNTKLKQYNLIR